VRLKILLGLSVVNRVDVATVFEVFVLLIYQFINKIFYLEKERKMSLS
jgi:hypothetical protein